MRRSVSRPCRGSNRSSRSIAGEHVAVAVDDDERRRIVRGKVGRDQMLQRLRLAVARAADDVHVLEACFQGKREGERRLHECGQERVPPRYAATISGGDRSQSFGTDDFVRRRLHLLRRHVRHIEEILPQLHARAHERQRRDRIRARRARGPAGTSPRKRPTSVGGIEQAVERHRERGGSLVLEGRCRQLVEEASEERAQAFGKQIVNALVVLDARLNFDQPIGDVLVLRAPSASG